MRNVAGVTAFFGRVEFRKGEDEFMRSIREKRYLDHTLSLLRIQPPRFRFLMILLNRVMRVVSVFPFAHAMTRR